jgi:hypothetical protein
MLQMTTGTIIIYAGTSSQPTTNTNLKGETKMKITMRYSIDGNGKASPASDGKCKTTINPGADESEKTKGDAEMNASGKAKTNKTAKGETEMKKAAKRELSGAALTAKMIKLELGKTFPGVKFSATSEYFSMGNSVNVSWTDGPVAGIVQRVIAKYQYGTFDSMTDCYEYEGIDESLGCEGAKYVDVKRNMSDARMKELADHCMAKFGEIPERFADEYSEYGLNECKYEHVFPETWEPEYQALGAAQFEEAERREKELAEKELAAFLAREAKEKAEREKLELELAIFNALETAKAEKAESGNAGSEAANVVSMAAAKSAKAASKSAAPAADAASGAEPDNASAAKPEPPAASKTAAIAENEKPREKKPESGGAKEIKIAAGMAAAASLVAAACETTARAAADRIAAFHEAASKAAALAIAAAPMGAPAGAAASGAEPVAETGAAKASADRARELLRMGKFELAGLAAKGDAGAKAEIARRKQKRAARRAARMPA